MRVLDVARLSTRMFRTRPLRTWLTIMGIGVGIGAVLFLVSLGYGLQNVVLEKIVFNQALLSLTVTQQTDTLTIDNGILQKFAELPEVKDVAPLAAFIGQGGYGDLSANIQVRAVDPQYFDYGGLAPSVGKVFKGDENGIVISSAVLKLLDMNGDETGLGKELNVQVFAEATETTSTLGMMQVNVIPIPEPFRIVGIIDEAQESFLYMPLKQISKYVNVTNYEQAQVRIKRSEDIPSAKDKIIDIGFQVMSLSETVDQANKIFYAMQVVLGLFGAVSLIVSAIGMFNTMTVTLLERTNEIGIMRSLGGSKRDMQFLFLAESIVIGILGGGVGIVMGYTGGQFFNWLINTAAVRFGGASVDLFSTPMWFLVVIMSISTVIGFFSGYFPARKASKMDPLEALKYK